MRVQGVGPVPCSVMVIGEGPGREEDDEGIPFVGKSGLLLDTALFQNGVSRGRVYITNVVKERLTNKVGEDRTPTDTEIREALPELMQEISEVDPDYILLVGAASVKAICGDRFWLEAHHGQFHDWVFDGRTRQIMPCYHPAAGMHNPVLSPHFAWGVREFVQGCQKRHHYYGQEPSWHYLESPRLPIWLRGRVAIDTEGTARSPFCISFSGVRFEGWVTKDFSKVKIGEGTNVILHHAIWDMGVMEAAGFNPLEWDIDDTMLKAFNLQIEPQALKNLVARHLGRVRPEYEDIVAPVRNQKMLGLAKSRAELYEFAHEKLRLAKKAPGKKRGVPAAPALDPREISSLEAAKDEHRWAYNIVRDLQAKKTVNLESRFKANGVPIPSVDLNDVPVEEWAKYASDDASDTLLISDILDEQLDQMQLRPVYEMDRAVLPMLYEMQRNGLPVDPGRAVELLGEFNQIIVENENILRRIAGRDDFNPRSTGDIKSVLYGTLGFEAKRKTRTREDSTDDRAISLLAAQIQLELDTFKFRETPNQKRALEFIKALQEVRELYVYAGTHLKGMLDYIRDDGRLRYKWKYTRVVSGRFSTEDFNVLNLPTRTERGKKVRSCFVADDDWVIASADLSQIELRVMAHLSRDQEMIHAFWGGQDLHARTASLLFGIPLDAVTTVQRYAAKTLNFAILYGISAQSLYEQLIIAGIREFDLKACQGLIDEWFKIYSGARVFFDFVLNQTRQDGYVRDMWGRIRHLPNIYLPATDWRGRALRAEAERQACNLTIQGGATGVIKRAMKELWSVLKFMVREKEPIVQPLLQIHDELLFLVRKGYEDVIRNIVQAAMVSDESWFTVPLKSDWEVAQSWGGMK